MLGLPMLFWCFLGIPARLRSSSKSLPRGPACIICMVVMVAKWLPPKFLFNGTWFVMIHHDSSLQFTLCQYRNPLMGSMKSSPTPASARENCLSVASNASRFPRITATQVWTTNLKRLKQSNVLGVSGPPTWGRLFSVGSWTNQHKDQAKYVVRNEDIAWKTQQQARICWDLQ